jgi:hypothetical protein
VAIGKIDAPVGVVVEPNLAFHPPVLDFTLFAGCEVGFDDLERVHADIVSEPGSLLMEVKGTSPASR